MRSLMTWTWVFGLAVTTLIGCGGNNPAQTDTGMTDGSAGSSFADSSLYYGATPLPDSGQTLAASPAPTTASSANPLTTPTLPIATASTSPIAPPGTLPSASPVATPSAGPTIAPMALRASVASQRSKGLLMFQRLEVTPRVQNPSWVAVQSGILIVTFTKNGQNVGTVTQKVSLQPAEIRDYAPVTSEKPADSVSVQVVTD
jgi:hypothetical protein